MKISEVLTKLDLSKKEKYYIHGNFLQEFDLNEYDIDADKLNFECIRIVTWYCTDSWVGIKVILLDDVPICISQQDGRKCDVWFSWVSKDCYLKTKNVIEKAKIEKEPSISFINQEEEFGDDYTLSFAEEIIPQFHNVAYYNGKKVSVSKGNFPFGYVQKNVIIIFEDDKTEIVEIGKLKFPLMGLK